MWAVSTPKLSRLLSKKRACALRLITWNINSVRLRLDLVAHLVKETAPDVLCLQETKVIDDLFPSAALAEMGFTHQHFYGIKGYNGVAILSKRPFTATKRLDWVGRTDGRHIAVELKLKNKPAIEVHNIYVPAGGDEPNPETNEKFAHKLAFLTELTRWFGDKKNHTQPLVLVGDLNIAPLQTDVWSHKQLLKVVSHTPIEIDHLEALRQTANFVDAVRHIIPVEEQLYSWWSYRSRDWKTNNRGRRLDHVWVTPQLSENIHAAQILSDARDWIRPSDHVPVIVDLKE
jgi:exodeoxyribonuclease III